MTIHKDLILRLIKYRRVLAHFHSIGMEQVFSNNLGDAIGVTAALVRKDMTMIAFHGNRRGGYSVNSMLTHMENMLGTAKENHAVMVGCGNLGHALLNYSNLKLEGVKIVAGFDTEPTETEIAGVPIHPMQGIGKYIKSHQIRVAILAVPAATAASCRDILIDAGVEGILNFAPIELKSTKTCIISNVNIGLEMEKLFFLVKEKK